MSGEGFPEPGQTWMDKNTGNNAFVISTLTWFDTPYVVISYELSPPLILTTEHLMYHYSESTDAVAMEDMV